MFSDSSDIVSFFSKAAYALRYEITCGLAMVLFYCFAKLASFSQRSSPNRVAKRDSMSPTSKQVHKKRNSPPNPMTPIDNIVDVDPKLLCDPRWLVPQVVLLCQAQLNKSLALYRSAIAAGLNIEDVSSEDRQHLFSAMVIAAIRTSNADVALKLLREVRDKSLFECTDLFNSVAKISASKQMFRECLAAYDFIMEDPSFRLTDKSVWSCLLFSAVETHAFDRCSFFCNQLKAHGVPSYRDFGNMIRFASQTSDWVLAMKFLKEMKVAATEIEPVIYNTVLATCIGAGQMEAARGVMEEAECKQGATDVITYNTVMKGYAKAGNMDHCVEIFEHMKQQGHVPSQVSYGIILDGFINGNQIERAGEIFNTMIKEGVPANTVLFTTLIKGFTRAGDVDQAMKIYEEMCNDSSVTPDVITYSILIKANCDALRLEVALNLLDDMVKQSLHPDEVLFNNLLTGCAGQKNPILGKRLYADMVASGIRPSNATFSILIRLYAQCKMLDDAIDMLKNEPGKHKVNPEPRLFLQLAQSCIRERQGKLAVDVYNQLATVSLPTASTHSTLIQTCIKLNMLETASEIVEIAATKRYRIDARDCNAALEITLRKNKVRIAEDIACNMRKLGLPIDAKHVACLQ
jgi:pentatricopeptide repeat protein